LNWLAHVFLSEEHIDFQIGNFLADPLKGKLWEGATSDMTKGMQTHIIIDTFTDAHKNVSRSKARLREKGLLKPIVMDLTYDYLLTKNWDRYSNIPIDEFTHTFYTNAQKRTPLLPTKANEFIHKIIERDVLNKYQNLEQLKVAFERMDKRLSAKLLARETNLSYIEEVTENIDTIEEDFLEFFPQLCQKVKENVNQEKLLHWKL
jgi:acyl carrier protein phosphodiesterase